jgi:Xaa-Pro dipeptidase
MPIVTERAQLAPALVEEIQRQLQEQALDGWLLYDFRGTNPVACRMVGLPALSRRWLVWIPREGAPRAIAHAIERQPWDGWAGEVRGYLSHEQLDAELADAVGGRRIAAEYSPGGAVPTMDRLGGGALERVALHAREVVSSGDLVTYFHARWSEEGLASHRAAARALRATVEELFRSVGERLAAGETPREWEVQDRLRAALAARGVSDGADGIVAVGENAANPHYAPRPGGDRELRPGSLLLVDLWGRTSPQGVFADQTWMAWIGEGEVPPRVRRVWEAVRDARLAVVDFIAGRWAAGDAVAGWEADDVARGLISERGFGDAFIHRTGHSIDTELHGSGPNLDHLETRDTRRLLQGVGFSVEPGVYLPGELGVRSEINVFMGPGGPEVTTPEPQRELWRIV